MPTEANKKQSHIITIIVSITAVIVSVAQLVIMHSEIKLNETIHTQEMRFHAEQNRRQWMLDATKFVLENRNSLFECEDEESKQVVQLMNGMFPDEVFSRVSVIMESTSRKAGVQNEWRRLRRAKYSIQYFIKKKDEINWKGASQLLRKEGFHVLEPQETGLTDIVFGNNSIVYGEGVNIEDVKEIAHVILAAGMELKSISPFRDRSEQNLSEIQILYMRTSHNMPICSHDDIDERINSLIDSDYLSRDGRRRSW